LGGRAVRYAIIGGGVTHLAFGNSIGDRQMCEYTKAGAGARLAMVVLRDNGEREYYRRSNPHSQMTGGTAGRRKLPQRLISKRTIPIRASGHHPDFAPGFSRTNPLTGRDP
jgi:hypothetical protein